MTDQTAFTDDEWHALTDAPLHVTSAVFAAGEHGPISMVKEASASARMIAKPGAHGVATELIVLIAAGADSKQARQDMKAGRSSSIDEMIANALTALEPAAAALKKIAPVEAAEVGKWFVAIATAVAEAAKTVNPKEQETIDKIAALFGVAAT